MTIFPERFWFCKDRKYQDDYDDDNREYKLAFFSLCLLYCVIIPLIRI